jgi:hypothetical protein
MTKPIKYTEAQMPTPGSVFVTRLADGRFGALIVIARKTESGYCSVYVAPSSWIGSQPIRPTDGELRQPLILTHHSWGGVDAGVWVSSPPPDSFVHSGFIEVTDSDLQRIREIYCTWERCTLQILLQWRWIHDRERLLIEDAERAVREAAERKEKAQRHAEMLRTITLASLAERQWFDHWDDELDRLYIEPSRRIVQHMLASLAESSKITKTVARKHLKAAVVAFNRLDEIPHYIETTHREDICEALELVLFAARHPELASAIDDWRDW